MYLQITNSKINFNKLTLNKNEWVFLPGRKNEAGQEMKPEKGGCVTACGLGGLVLEEGCWKFEEIGLGIELKSKKKKGGRRLSCFNPF